MKLHLTEIPERKTKYEKRREIFNNGEDNKYPSMVERLINSSTTASACAKVVSSFIECNGFVFENELKQQAKNKHTFFNKRSIEINDKKDTPNSLLSKVAQELAYQRGVFLHLNYNALYQITSVQVVPFKHCRLGRQDSKGYKGKIAVYDNWDFSKESRFNEKNIQLFDVYNPNPEVVQAQVEKAGGWNFYKGQILFMNLDHNDTYPLAFINPVMLDCQSEYKSSQYTNASFKRGFFGKHLLFVKPFVSERDRTDFLEILKKSTGVESQSSVIVLEKDLNSDEFKQDYSLEPIQSNVNDKLFQYADKKTANNIRKAFSNVPVVLIDTQEGRLGNTSGESFTQAQIFMQNQLEKTRNEVEYVFNDIFSVFHKPISTNGIFEIQKLV